jgi:DNA integrity scanning protein DisA with diadenylate cyclase activity
MHYIGDDVKIHRLSQTADRELGPVFCLDCSAAGVLHGLCKQTEESTLNDSYWTLSLQFASSLTLISHSVNTGRSQLMAKRKMMRTPEEIFHGICSTACGINCETLQQTIILAIEIAREGREGRKIGTLFVVGDAEEVLKHSRSLILDPLYGHPDELKFIHLPDMRETVKELAQLDGAFVVSNEGVVLSACRYIDAFSEGIRLPLGLGSRHVAAASITKQTQAVAVVVSESSIVRIFDDGEIISEILPELWMFARYSSHLEGPVSEIKEEDMTIVSKAG